MVEALGARAEPIAYEALAQIPRQDSSPQIQREAVETLGDFKDRRGVPVLTELARAHPDIEVRREAIETLGDVIPAESIRKQALEVLLESDHPKARELFDRALGRAPR